MSNVLSPYLLSLHNIEFLVVIATDELNISHVEGTAFILVCFVCNYLAQKRCEFNSLPVVIFEVNVIDIIFYFSMSKYLHVA
jgi:hypothetical protein